jgi:hypothetical protein
MREYGGRRSFNSRLPKGLKNLYFPLTVLVTMLKVKAASVGDTLDPESGLIVGIVRPSQRYPCIVSLPHGGYRWLEGAAGGVRGAFAG